MTDVGAWEPPPKRLGEPHRAALDAAAAAVADDALMIDEDLAERVRQVVNAASDERTRLFEPQGSDRLTGWLHALTLAEETIPGCEAGARSPVILIARLLRERGDYPADLTQWIKRVSSNRFLPYGSLTDRLRG